MELPTLKHLLHRPDAPFIDRDLSWIQFNERVLAEARPDSNPALKKLKFLAISSSNLDEFFMIRFAGHARAVGSKKEIPPEKIRVHDLILEQVRAFTHKQAKTLNLLKSQLKPLKLYLHFNQAKSAKFLERSRSVFLEQVLPKLQLNKGFHYAQLKELRNLQMLALLDDGEWIEIPKSLPAVITQVTKDQKGVDFFFLDDLIVSHLKPLLGHDLTIFRITRDADFNVDLSDEDSESIPDIIKTSLGHRDNGRVVRLQVLGNCSEASLSKAQKILGLDPKQVFLAPYSMCLHGLFGAVLSLPTEIRDRKGFNNPPSIAMIPPPFTTPKTLFAALEKQDFILHHPYDSFDAYINFIKAACDDPSVVSIEQTIYRTDSYSEIIELLKKAAKKKKIVVILELRARFDEWNNLKLAEELQKAGVKVYFGFGQLKLHAKICLVTAVRNGSATTYTHLSTGNYNAKTARAYTDIGILTANAQIGSDARNFFDSVIQEKIPSHFKQIVTAPTRLHQRIKSLIEAETQAAMSGKSAHIIAKVNALVDENIVQDLYRASQAGVKIDLIVRGACSLIPGVKGLSERIRVISIVDRYLEHSRIYYFGHSRKIYLSSADWMPRNFFSRLEIAFPILDERLYRYIVDIVLPAYLADTVKAKELSSQGVWKKIHPKNKKAFRAQNYFEELAQNYYKNTSLYENLNPNPPRPSR